ncbi:hypothetical protein ED92_38495 [Amycolatopsis sp. MJM2582]|uniref:hypothetical protein n=1 Tax=Amycolatopsis sp. MJM2582 TaxID=1427749 RepID=UPI0005045AFB|nr:hypothetical protein [Amycolatopsis sp. MJM2582]KFZ77002.1 hypothetical protein ED92_38495 [Amycolatopsis sp. MJM2582]
MRDLAERPVTFNYDYNMACSACPALTPLTSTDYHQQINQAHIACHGCGASIHFGRAVMALRDAADPALDDGYLTGVAWYHTSTYSDWPVGSRTMPAATLDAHREHMSSEAAENARARHENQALHVGTYEAAIESMLRRMSDQDDGGAQFFLYRVALRVLDLVVERGWRDENTEHAARLSQDDLGDADVVRYLNLFESPGSISLAIRPSAIAATQQIALPVDTLRDGVEPSLLAEVGAVRIEHERREAERLRHGPSPLDLLRRKVEARRDAIAGLIPTVRQKNLPQPLHQLLVDRYLPGVSEPVRERFTSAMRAWHGAQETLVGDADYVTRFASMAPILTRHQEVRQLIAADSVTTFR